MALVGLVLAGCLGAPDSPPGPAATIEAFHEHVDADRWDEAHRLFDYEHRLAEVLGPLWTAGSEEGRERLVALGHELFEETARKHWETAFSGGADRLLERWEGPGRAWVDAQVLGADGETVAFGWRYRLHRTLGEAGSEEGAGPWRITQREVVQRSFVSDTAGFWPRAIRGLAEELGHRPSLVELAANLRSWVGRVRMHSYRVPGRVEPK